MENISIYWSHQESEGLAGTRPWVLSPAHTKKIWALFIGNALNTAWDDIPQTNLQIRSKLKPIKSTARYFQELQTDLKIPMKNKGSWMAKTISSLKKIKKSRAGSGADEKIKEMEWKSQNQIKMMETTSKPQERWVIRWVTLGKSAPPVGLWLHLAQVTLHMEPVWPQSGLTWSTHSCTASVAWCCQASYHFSMYLWHFLMFSAY